MNNIKEFTEDQLQCELNRRDQETKAQKLQVDIEYSKTTETLLNENIVNLICPKHGRTSCSDENLINGFWSNGEGQLPRCNRCALMSIVNRLHPMPLGFRIQVNILKDS